MWYRKKRKKNTQINRFFFETKMGATLASDSNSVTFTWKIDEEPVKVVVRKKRKKNTQINRYFFERKNGATLVFTLF